VIATAACRCPCGWSNGRSGASLFWFFGDLEVYTLILRSPSPFVRVEIARLFLPIDQIFFLLGIVDEI
jgi:hypothetical protein